MDAEKHEPGNRAALSIRETAAVLGLSRRSVERAVAAGLLRSCKVAGRRLVPRRAIDELLGDAQAA